MTTHPVHVLLVEDNPGDVLLTREAFAGATVPPVLSVVPDGESALAYLRRGPGYEHSVVPDLVLLDLNLPGKTGCEVLAEVKADVALRAMPVVVLTSSRDLSDIAAAYGEHANTYVAKPATFSEYEQVVRCIERYWFDAAELPRST